MSKSLPPVLAHARAIEQASIAFVGKFHSSKAKMNQRTHALLGWTLALLSNRRIRLATVICVLYALVACQNGENRVRYADLKANYRVASGQIYYQNCDNHGEMWYSFVVDSREYRSMVVPATLYCRSTEINSRINVYYNPIDPSINSNLPPEEAFRYYSSLRPSFSFILVGGLAIVALSKVLLNIRVRRKKRAAGE